MFPGLTELHLIGCLIELIWIPRSKSNTSTPKTNLLTFWTKGSFTRDEWNHLLCLFNISHFSPTVYSSARAKRSQQDSGEERVTAKSKPMMNLIARTPSIVSSSTLASPVKRYYGKQDPWKSVVAEDRSGQPDQSLQQIIQNWIMTVLGLLKSGKVKLRCTIDQGNLIKLLGVWYNKFVLITEKLFSTEMRNP